MMRRLKVPLAAIAGVLVVALLWVGLALAAGFNGFNGTGSVTRPANTTAYTSNKLYAANTAGNAVSTAVTVANTSPGDNYITGARIFTTGTGATGAAYKVHLFGQGGTPTLTALVDGSTYIGPYAADLANFIGTLTCGSLVATNDGSAQFYADCTLPTSGTVRGLRFTGAGGQAVATVLRAVFQVTTGYTPISGEVLTLYLASARQP